MNLEEAQLIAKAILADPIVELNKAFPRFEFLGEGQVRETIEVMHMPVKLCHEAHGLKVAYMQKEAEDDIRNGWRVVKENAFVEKPITAEKEEQPEPITQEDLIEDLKAGKIEMSSNRDELIAMAKALGKPHSGAWGIRRLQREVYDLGD